MSYNKHFSTRATPQTEQAEPTQVVNNAGGYTFQLDKWAHLDRFLILGCEGGTYYCSESKLTKENGKNILALIAEDAVRVLKRTVEVSDQALGIKNDPAIFVLAMLSAHAPVAVRKQVYDALPSVCRTSTHLFMFCEFREAFGGWGAGMRRAVGRWYLNKSPNDLAYQAVKYRQRNGWTHRDVLRLSHPKPTDELLTKVIDKIVHPAKDIADLPFMYEGYLRASTAEKPDPKLIADYRLTWEMVPTEWLSSAAVWEALLPNMPLTALTRNLGVLTSIELLKPLGAKVKDVIRKLTDVENISKSRMHPYQALLALKTYSAGKGFRGSKTWTPVPDIVAALENMFYACFANVEPTGKNWLLALDVSGSMSNTMANSNLSYCEATAALAMVTARTEKNNYVMGFAHEFRDLGIHREHSLREAVKRAHDNNFGSTYCSVPILWALQKNIEVDVFVVLTDNETYAGRVHPHQALRTYRERVNPRAKMIVVGMAASPFTIADQNDAGMLDISGFDASAPQAMRQFVVG